MSVKKVLAKNHSLLISYKRYLNKKAIKANKKYSPEFLTKAKWKNVFGYDIDLNNPKTLNEKIQWLKLNDWDDIYTVWADKYGCREYLKTHFGDDVLIPLIMQTDNQKEINKRNITVFPCVIKPCHTSGDYIMLRNPKEANWNRIRRECNYWMTRDYYAESQERQYQNIKRRIIVEKMLLDSNGKIPNDYKLNFIEGELVFIYCSIDRENKNYRQIYDPSWSLLPFTWDAGGKPQNTFDPIEKPKNLERMIEIGKHFASRTHYVRVDFYEVDGKLYCGEITLYHGGGFDKFVPNEYDNIYGEMLKIPC